MTEEQRTLRAFLHSRKGRLQGYVAADDDPDSEWLFLELTDDAGRHGFAGDTLTLRRNFMTEIEPKP